MHRQYVPSDFEGGVLLGTADVGGDHLRALTGEDPDRRLCHPRARTGDDRHLVVQLAHHGPPCQVSRLVSEYGINMTGSVGARCGCRMAMRL